jgi:hypothetical protein
VSYGQSTGAASGGDVTYTQHGGWGFTSGGGSTSSFEERYTGLAVLLAPPAEPTYESPWGCGSIGLALLCVVDLVGILFITASGGGAGLNLLLVNGGFWGAVLVAVVWTRLSQTAERQSTIPERHAKWTKAMLRWDASYYCHKDGVVFVPGQAGTVPAPEFPAIMAT